jgi:vitamin B12/bleomycin/antimicrobial peptide transport system ATP-binding/permease protein
MLRPLRHPSMFATDTNPLPSSRAALAQLRRLVLPYFQSEDRWAGRGLLAAVVAMELASVAITVLLNSWNLRFYNALQQRDAPVFAHELIVFSLLAGALILLAVYQLYLNQWLQIRWRQWMTDRFLGGWLTDSLPYRMQLSGETADNPDQRIAEDIKLLVSGTLSLGIGLFSAVTTLASFTIILWQLSNAAPLVLFGHPLPVPGYLLWAALLYAVAGTAITHWIGRPLVGLNFEQQQREADFRASLLRARENAEQIALLKGESAERVRLSTRFARVRTNWVAIMRRQKRLTFFTAGYGQVQVIVPFLVAGPAYFSRAIELGGLMQTVSAFGRVQGALSFFVEVYPRLAEWQSVVERLSGFDRSIDAVTGARRPNICAPTPTANTISSKGLLLKQPNGSLLLDVGQIDLHCGETTLLLGPSGVGKSTLLRAVAGIWPHGEGRIEIPAGANVLILPQRPYLPDGSLREAIAYPLLPGRDADAHMRQLLVDVGLPSLVDRLCEHAHWQNLLSLGEQQRLTIIRAILLKPNWLFLDEATSSLDEASERRSYDLLRRHLPQATIVSVGHRSSLRAFHTQSIDMLARRRDDGETRLSHPGTDRAQPTSALRGTDLLVR